MRFYGLRGHFMALYTVNRSIDWANHKTTTHGSWDRHTFYILTPTASSLRSSSMNLQLAGFPSAALVNSKAQCSPRRWSCGTDLGQPLTGHFGDGGCRSGELDGQGCHRTYRRICDSIRFYHVSDAFRRPLGVAFSWCRRSLGNGRRHRCMFSYLLCLALSFVDAYRFLGIVYCSRDRIYMPGPGNEG